MKKVVSMILVLSVGILTGCSNNKPVSANVDANKEQTTVQASSSTQKVEVKKSADNNKNSKDDITSEKNSAALQVSSSSSSNTIVKKNKVIVIDPGHANRSNLNKEALSPGSSVLKIKDGGGAQGIVTKTPEYEVNMKVALRLKDLLQKDGYTVVMTKTEDSQSLGNIERADIWNKANASLAIRIHADSSNSSSVKGASMLVPAPINANTKSIYSESKRCGQVVLNTLVNEIGMTNRGIIESSDMTGFNWSKVPVILIEMGFLSNPSEDKLLSTSAYQDKLAKALADGINNAVK